MTTGKDLAYRYDWQEETKKGRFGSLIDWATTVVVSSNRQEDVIDHLSELTNGFTECVMRITLNGVEVDAQHLMTRLDETLDHGIESGVQEKIKEFGYFSELNEAMSRAQTAAKEALYAEMAAFGIKIPYDDY